MTPAPDERFRSEFFTREIKDNIIEHLVKIITEILECGWICAWSYSDSGDANIVKVIDMVYNETKCEIKSYSVPYTHKPQGGASKKIVIEYLIIFIPGNVTI